MGIASVAGLAIASPRRNRPLRAAVLTLWGGADGPCLARSRGVTTRAWVGLLSVLALACLPKVAGADNYYRFVDDEGVVHYTNAPTQPGYHRFSTGPSARSASRPAGFDGYATEVLSAAARYGIDARLVDAVIRVESGGNAGAVSPKGAQGLMQLMPATAGMLGVENPFDPRQNVDGGVCHLRGLLDTFGDLSLALAAYNAGAEPVRAYGGVPPYRETQEYVRKILQLYSGPSSFVSGTTQRVYRMVNEDGTPTFTNLPPRLKSAR